LGDLESPAFDAELQLRAGVMQPSSHQAGLLLEGALDIALISAPISRTDLVEGARLLAPLGVGLLLLVVLR
jgi:hypothetical protein